MGSTGCGKRHREQLNPKALTRDAGPGPLLTLPISITKNCGMKILASYPARVGQRNQIYPPTSDKSLDKQNDSGLKDCGEWEGPCSLRDRRQSPSSLPWTSFLLGEGNRGRAPADSLSCKDRAERPASTQLPCS